MVKAGNDFYDYGVELFLGSILPLVMFKSFWKLSQVEDIVAHIQIINPLRRPLTLSTNSESASSGVFNSPLQLQLEYLHCPFSGDCKIFGYVINAVHKCVDGNLDLAWKMWRVLHWIEMELASRQEGVDLNQAVQTECLCHHHRKIAPWK